MADRLKNTLAADEPITRIKGVSAQRAKALNSLGVYKIRDLLSHYPRRYMDLSKVCSIRDASIGQVCTILCRVHAISSRRPRPRLSITEITMVDDTGTLMLTFFNQPWLERTVKVGSQIACAGKVEFNYGFKRMTNPMMEAADEIENTCRILPVHPASSKISVGWMRALVRQGLTQTFGIYDFLPPDLRIKRGLESRGTALRNIHFPGDMGQIGLSRRRLVYDEVLLLELFLMRQTYIQGSKLKPIAHEVDGSHVHALRESLPFDLTGDQERAVRELFAEMGADHIANHMLLGDVGCGKTIVCAFGFAAAVDSGGQGMLLAPTEVLASQHFAALDPIFRQAGIICALLTGSTPRDKRARIIDDLALGQIDVLIGTHALLEDDVVPKRCTFVVIDEQQRFGVRQRAKMISKGPAVDALYMSATPIPRSLALTLFGNLTMSFIRQKPHAGGVRKTYVLSKNRVDKAYAQATQALERGEQVYVVCPLIGLDSTARDTLAGLSDSAEGMAIPAQEGPAVYHPAVSIERLDAFREDNPSAAREQARFLQAKIFPDHKVGLLHSKLVADERKDVMDRFRKGEIEVLVSTTVIEVGVDVPSATVMIIEDADRFGLSQLHQLRGRVGRAGLPSYVYLVSASKKEAAMSRLFVLAESDDGFEIAERDLKFRREGDLLGNRQSGQSSLKLTNIIRDKEIIEAAHEDAKEIMAVDPELARNGHAALLHEIGAVFENDDTPMGG